MLAQYQYRQLVKSAPAGAVFNIRSTAFVDKILAAKKADENAVKNWEAQIDALVAQLYGLTLEEIAIVEGQ